MTATATLPEPTAERTTLFEAHALVVEKLEHPVRLLAVFTDTEPGPFYGDVEGANLTMNGYALVDILADLLGAASEALWKCVYETVHEDGVDDYVHGVAKTVSLCSAAAEACREEGTAGQVGALTSNVLRTMHARLEPLYREAVEA